MFGPANVDRARASLASLDELLAKFAIVSEELTICIALGDGPPMMIFNLKPGVTDQQIADATSALGTFEPNLASSLEIGGKIVVGAEFMISAVEPAPSDSSRRLVDALGDGAAPLEIAFIPTEAFRSGIRELLMDDALGMLGAAPLDLFAILIDSQAMKLQVSPLAETPSLGLTLTAADAETAQRLATV